MENNTQPRIGIILPSRGLIFAETEEYIEKIRNNYPNIKVYRSHNLTLPTCFNTLVEEALADPKKVDYIWHLEEDVVGIDNLLDKFFEAMKEYDIAALDYGFNSGSNTIVRSAINNEILFCGTGCTFIKREVFEKLPKPWFKSDKGFNISTLSWWDTNPHNVYGMHDIYFFSLAKKYGFKITQIEGEARHLQLLALGQKEINNGVHSIGEKGRIERKLTLALKEIPI